MSERKPTPDSIEILLDLLKGTRDRQDTRFGTLSAGEWQAVSEAVVVMQKVDAMWEEHQRRFGKVGLKK